MRETPKAKGYNLKEVETEMVRIGEELRRLLEKLADDKPVVRNNDQDKPEVTILKRGGIAHSEDSMKEIQPGDQKVVQKLVEKIPEDILRRTTFRKKKVSFSEEAEHLD